MLNKIKRIWTKQKVQIPNWKILKSKYHIDNFVVKVQR